MKISLAASNAEIDLEFGKALVDTVSGDTPPGTVICNLLQDVSDAETVFEFKNTSDGTVSGDTPPLECAV